jgi:hypothetical protein
LEKAEASGLFDGPSTDEHSDIAEGTHRIPYLQGLGPPLSRADAGCKARATRVQEGFRQGYRFPHHLPSNPTFRSRELISAGKTGHRDYIQRIWTCGHYIRYRPIFEGNRILMHPQRGSSPVKKDDGQC